MERVAGLEQSDALLDGRGVVARSARLLVDRSDRDGRELITVLERREALEHAHTHSLDVFGAKAADAARKPHGRARNAGEARFVFGAIARRTLPSLLPDRTTTENAPPALLRRRPHAPRHSDCVPCSGRSHAYADADTSARLVRC